MKANNSTLLKITKPLSITLMAAAMTWSMSAAAGPYNYDQSVGLTSSHECGVGENTRLISTSDVSSNGSNATTCFGAYSGNNNFNTLLWNSQNWTQVDKIDVNGAGDQSSALISLTFNGNLAEGSWTFNGDASDWDSFFVVTKAANDPGWAAYYFDSVPSSGDLNGLFTIPWSAGNSSNPAGLSHLSLYAKRSASVPEPGTLGLLGLGLMGVAVWRRRK